MQYIIPAIAKGTQHHFANFDEKTLGFIIKPKKAKLKLIKFSAFSAHAPHAVPCEAPCKGERGNSPKLPPGVTARAGREKVCVI